MNNSVPTNDNIQNNNVPNNNVPTNDNNKIEIPEENTFNQDVVPRTDILNDTVKPAVITNSEPVIVNEKLKKVEINYTPPSKFKMFVLFVFFILLIGFVLFLPEITSMVHKYKSGAYSYKEEKITTGRMSCSLSSSTTNLDKNYDIVFNFTDNLLERTSFSITTIGDPSLDEEALDGLNESCKALMNEVSSIEGVTVNCNYTEGKLVEKQSFDLAKIDSEKLDAAYHEVGGNNPEYQYHQDMDKIEKGMNASGYTCKRES